jgi:dUTP pyrophosphatase
MNCEVKKFLKIKVRKIHPNAQMPTYATEGAACFDLYAATVNDEARSEYIFSTSRLIIGTGLVFEIPPGYMMRIAPRSGLAFKHGVIAFPGVIDSDFRGEVKVLLHRRQDASGFHALQITPGDRIAQAYVCEIPQIKFEEVDELTETERGDGGFGSTGV